MKIKIVCLLALFACNPQARQQTKQADPLGAALPQIELALKKFAGTYVWEEDPQGYSQTLMVKESEEGQYMVQFTASQIKGKLGCSFEGVDTLSQDTLKIPINWHDKTVHMTLFLRNDTMHVFTDNFEDRFALNYYCSGGGSLAGDYYRKSE